MRETGLKTERLKELQEMGYTVPAFTFISNTQLAEFLSDKKKMERGVREIQKKLNSKSYAVRSSALIEDSASQSFAGQFMTKIEVAPEALAGAIEDVARQAKDILKYDLSKFSIIVQEYIDPDYSGVTFTRNPMGGREMVVEYHKGTGEYLVSGRIKPEREDFFWSKNNFESELPAFTVAVTIFKKIEKHYGFPQDIEWCIKDNEWYLLQTRPVTTITPEDYELYLYLDKTLPGNGKYYYEKTEISEIAARPVPVTAGLLEKIYAKGGPVDIVYKKYGIVYEPGDVLKIIGNELLIDREEELKSILPAYSYFAPKNDNLKGLPVPRLQFKSGFFRTLSNYLRLSSVSPREYEAIFVRLKDLLAGGGDRRDDPAKGERSLKKIIEQFLIEYELVFEINFLTAYAYKRLESALQKDKDRLVRILGKEPRFFGLEDGKEIEFRGDNLKGNSLDIADETEFVRNGVAPGGDTELEDWWKSMPDYRKKMLEKPLRYALLFNSLREYSRWLVVKNVNKLRSALLAEAEVLTDSRLVYFADLEDSVIGNFNNDELLKRKSEYESMNGFNMPKQLYYKVIEADEDLLPVSAGEAEGELVTEETLKKQGGAAKGKYILYVRNLEPSLSAYFGKIQGIVSEQGSLLSHLAIIAREENLPVIVNFKPGINGVKIGDKIRMIINPPHIDKI